MNKKLLTLIGIVLVALLLVASVVMFIMTIWIPDDRWAQTGFILLCTAFGVGVATGLANT